MEVIVFGLNHKTAPVEIREKLSFSKSQISYAHKECINSQIVQELMILSTCNRVELFAVVNSTEESVKALKEFLAKFHHISPQILDDVSYFYTQKEAIRHLFRVACSLDSMVIGEPQILGQLKEAYNQALEDRSIGSWLTELVERSFHVAKKIRTETGICKNAVSISFAAVELAKKIFDKIEGKSVLLVGAGEMSELAARHLLSNGVTNIYVANRTHERAEELARQFNGQVLPFASVKENLELMDIIITSTSAPHFLFNKEEVQKTLHRRKNRPLFFIDIAVPRNVDPAVSKCSDVYVYDIDDLQMVVNSNLLERQKEAKYAETIVERFVEQFWEKLNSRNVVPTIVELTQKFEAIRQQELKKAFSKLPNLSDAEREVISCLASAITKKMLHDPICLLKKKSNCSNTAYYIQAAKELFNLDGFKRP
ncbi:MAG: glutamyl-tRNA reductase [bacterium]|nr:glutamyl-tRNA reductase [bacterium]